MFSRFLKILRLNRIKQVQLLLRRRLLAFLTMRIYELDIFSTRRSRKYTGDNDNVMLVWFCLAAAKEFGVR